MRKPETGEPNQATAVNSGQWPGTRSGGRAACIVVTIGGGGFSAEALSLVRAMGHRWRYVYLLGDLPETGLCKRLPFPGRVVRVKVPALIRYPVARQVGRFLMCLVQCMRVLWRERPVAVIGVAGSYCVPLLLAARLFGRKTVFVESLARTTKPSRTGRIIQLLNLADRFYVQWPTLLRAFPRARYAGRVV